MMMAVLFGTTIRHLVSMKRTSEGAVAWDETQLGGCGKGSDGLKVGENRVEDDLAEYTRIGWVCLTCYEADTV